MKKQRKQPQLSEHQIQQQIMDYLAYKGISHWRSNVGRKHYMQFGLKGSADITGLLKSGRRLEIEVKDRLGKQSKEQIEFQAMIENSNGLYILARSVEDVINKL
jgi:predicted porin